MVRLLVVDEVCFEVCEGEIFRMVGPNGAGGTTTTECLEGMRHPDSGQVWVLGLSPHHDGYTLRSRIGIQLQESALQDRIRVWEALDLFASFYPHSLDWEPYVEHLGLADKGDTPFAKLCWGQDQRLFNDPEIVFLDELTTGLDPQARRAMWDLVRAIRNHGKTVFLTTHFMEEAKRLYDRVAIIDNGRIVALGTPENLIRSLEAEPRVVFTVDGWLDPQVFSKLASVRRVEVIGERTIVHGHGDGTVGEAVNALTISGTRFRDLRTEQPTLEDVFLTLTGRAMRD